MMWRVLYEAPEGNIIISFTGGLGGQTRVKSEDGFYEFWGYLDKPFSYSRQEGWRPSLKLY
jgi:hypothetical protein